MKRTKYISGSIFKAGLLLGILILWLPLSGQDSLRTYGPRFGIDLARFIFILADPSETGAEASVDMEIYRNLYPVFELGYSSISEEEDLFTYSAGGMYARAGIDYNLLKLRDRSQHHTITLGARYGLSVFSHRAEHIYILNDYWGDDANRSYEQELKGHWAELVGGIRAELLPNLFLAWYLRYKILLNPDMDPRVTPQLVPGFGTGGQNRSFGMTYSIQYKIPLFKK